MKLMKIFTGWLEKYFIIPLGGGRGSREKEEREREKKHINLISLNIIGLS